MRKVCKIVSFIFVVVFVSVFCFSGCSNTRVLAKAGKKLNNYTIDLDVDIENMIVKGNELLKYTNRNETIVDYLIFHLYPTAFSEDANIKPYSSLSEARCFPNGVSYGDIEIINVKENGKSAKHEIIGEDNDKLKVCLDKSLGISDNVEISIEFILEIPNCTHRFGYYGDNINLGNFYPILSKYENGEYELIDAVAQSKHRQDGNHYGFRTFEQTQFAEFVEECIDTWGDK